MSASVTLKSSDAFRQKDPEHHPHLLGQLPLSSKLPVLVGLGGKLG